jgi:hypothetical protein
VPRDRPGSVNNNRLAELERVELVELAELKLRGKQRLGDDDLLARYHEGLADHDALTLDERLPDDDPLSEALGGFSGSGQCE